MLYNELQSNVRAPEPPLGKTGLNLKKKMDDELSNAMSVCDCCHSIIRKEVKIINMYRIKIDNNFVNSICQHCID